MSSVFRGSEEPRTAYGWLFSKLNWINKGTRDIVSGYTTSKTKNPLKRKWQYALSLRSLQTQTYDTSVMLAFKFFTRTLVPAFKSPNTVFVASSLFCIS